MARHSRAVAVRTASAVERMTGRIVAMVISHTLFSFSEAGAFASSRTPAHAVWEGATSLRRVLIKRPERLKVRFGFMKNCGSREKNALGLLEIDVGPGAIMGITRWRDQETALIPPLP